MNPATSDVDERPLPLVTRLTFLDDCPLSQTTVAIKGRMPRGSAVFAPD